MIRELKWKVDFAKTIDRFEAWWRCEVIDRPPVTLTVKPSRPYKGPVKRHPTMLDRWLDVQFNVERQIAELERREWLGDALPAVVPNVGPELTAALYGAKIQYLDERTGWSEPIIDDASQWDTLLARQPDFKNPYWLAIERMTQIAIDMANGRYLVGLTDLHGSFDLLAGLRDPEALCVDMLDCPDKVIRAAGHVASGYVEAFRRNWRQISAAGFGSTTWARFYHEGPAYLPSCDFWCMLSPRMVRAAVVPNIVTEMQPLSRSLFHLDGPQALGHLETVLSLPDLSGVQWVYGAGAGPASRWLEVYRRVLDAGKCVQVVAADPHDALAVLDALGPRGLWLTVQCPFDRDHEAQAFLREVEKRCARGSVLSPGGCR